MNNDVTYKYFKDLYDKLMILQKEVYKLTETLGRNKTITPEEYKKIIDISAGMISDCDQREALKNTCDRIISDYKEMQNDEHLKEYFEKAPRSKLERVTDTGDAIELTFVPVDMDPGEVSREITRSESEKLEEKKPGRQNGKKAAAEDVVKNLAKRWTLAAASSTPNKAARDLLLKAFAEMEKDEKRPEV